MSGKIAFRADCPTGLVPAPTPASAPRRPTHSQSGFTLIELLVVIAVIALLMAILLPTLARVRDQARDVVCRSNLRQWGVFFHLYTGDNEGYFHNGDISDWGHLWMEALWPYYGRFKDICLCPMAVRRSEVVRQGRNEMGTAFATWSVFTGHYEWDREGFFGSYGINGWARNPPREIAAQYNGNFPTENNWRRPDVLGGWQVPLFLDCRWPDGWMDDAYSPPEYEDESTWIRFCINRHDAAINGSFLDCSVRKIGLKELWKLKWNRKCDLNADEPIWPDWMIQFKDY